MRTPEKWQLQALAPAVTGSVWGLRNRAKECKKRRSLGAFTTKAWWELVMKRTSAAALGLPIMSSVPALLPAKGHTDKNTIQGAGPTPLRITGPVMGGLRFGQVREFTPMGLSSAKDLSSTGSVRISCVGQGPATSGLLRILPESGSFKLTQNQPVHPSR
jgi:hypothetical protein